MPWTINSEIYPLWARSTGNACAAGVNWTFNILVSLTFLHLAQYFTYYGQSLAVGRLRLMFEVCPHPSVCRCRCRCRCCCSCSRSLASRLAPQHLSSPPFTPFLRSGFLLRQEGRDLCRKPTIDLSGWMRKHPKIIAFAPLTRSLVGDHEVVGLLLVFTIVPNSKWPPALAGKQIAEDRKSPES